MIIIKKGPDHVHVSWVGSNPGPADRVMRSDWSLKRLLLPLSLDEKFCALSRAFSLALGSAHCLVNGGEVGNRLIEEMATHGLRR